MKQKSVFRRLTVQLVAMLSLALLPLGLIALYQTSRVAVEADRTAGLALLGLTERAARTEQLLIARAVGAARLFGSIAPDLLSDVDACATNLSRFVDRNPEYSFIGILPISGIVTCSSLGREIDFSDLPNFEERMAAQIPTIVVNKAPVVSETSVFVVSEPFEINDEFAGFVSISIPHEGLPVTEARLARLGLKELVTFNSEGTILTSRSSIAEATGEMPAGDRLRQLSIEGSQTFRAENAEGVERRYSIVTIPGSPAAVMAVWRVGEGAMSRVSNTVAPTIFPILMWIASMAVAILAIHTLVLRHITRLRMGMDRFADDRTLTLKPSDATTIPIELEELEQNFIRMSEEIANDEALTEDALREKTVLIKEIHHRVKNNLQLISSIMNMQIRVAEHDETRVVLRQVQERVLSLATIHRDLYQSQDGGRVNVGDLIREIVEKSGEFVSIDGQGIDLQTNIEPLMLYPDQAVPLSLLVSEAATNAAKFMRADPEDPTVLDVQLTEQGNEYVFEMTNSIDIDDAPESTGLGSKLMSAFALQIGGTLDAQTLDGKYRMSLRFKPQDFQPETRDF